MLTELEKLKQRLLELWEPHIGKTTVPDSVKQETHAIYKQIAGDLLSPHDALQMLQNVSKRTPETLKKWALGKTTKKKPKTTANAAPAESKLKEDIAISIGGAKITGSISSITALLQRLK